MVEEPKMEMLLVYGAICLVIAGTAAYARRVVRIQSKYRTAHPERAAAFLTVLDIAICVTSWYAVSVSLTIFNKWLYAIWRGGTFSLPLTATAMHMVVKALTARWLISSSWSPFQEEPYDVPAQLSCLIIMPIGIATAADIALSNASFLFITVTLYTVLKAGTLLWILLWGLCLRLESCSFAMALVCVSVSGGMAMASYSETATSAAGAALVLGAGCAGGLRWALSQRLMAVDDAFLDSPLLLISKIAPHSAWATVVAALATEGGELARLIREAWSSKDGGGGGSSSSSSSSSSSNSSSGGDDVGTAQVLLEFFGFLVAGGGLAFLLLIVEMKLLQLTSSLTMGIFGTVKEVLQVVLAVLILREHLTPLNAGGLALCIGGTLAFHRLRAGPAASGGGALGCLLGRLSGGDGMVDGWGEYDKVRLADVELAGFLNNDSDSDDGGLAGRPDDDNDDNDAFIDGTAGTLLDPRSARGVRRPGGGKGGGGKGAILVEVDDDGELSDGWDDHS